jgi:hypothetical protein
MPAPAKDGLVSRAPRAAGRTAAARARLLGLAQKQSLLSVPGIGQRSHDKLLSQNVDTVDKLCKLYSDEYEADDKSFEQYLKVRCVLVATLCAALRTLLTPHACFCACTCVPRASLRRNRGSGNTVQGSQCTRRAVQPPQLQQRLR